MDFPARVQKFFEQAVNNDRLAPNLAAIGVALAAVVVVWLLVRRLLAGRRTAPGRWTGIGWVDAVIQVAARGAQALLGWLAFTAAVGTVMVGCAYHLAGRNILRELSTWYAGLTSEQVLAFAWVAGKLVALAAGTRLAIGVVRRARPRLERRVAAWLKAQADEPSLARWFRLLERYALAMIVLATVWGASHVLGFLDVVRPAAEFTFRVLTILIVARLSTLACRALLRPAAEFGDRQLANTVLLHYWERLSRLFPLGDRCFEAAVYISAATLCVKELHWIAFVADYGPRVVQCIGIFFGTRVIIELLQVLLYEIFGLYREHSPANARGQTLVPLLHSGCRYLLYFGSMVMMMDRLGIPTAPVLAAASVVGLAVGLGAQSLVTDVVSGLFILFENQYLVGDFVEIGTAVGIVEAVAVRHTHIRDAQGKLHLIPNGMVKEVVNYSKGYVHAVVDICVPSGSDVDGVIRTMAEAGRILKKTRQEVLAETIVQGLVGLSLAEMTVRAITKVRPGTHAVVENEYRRILQQLFEQKKQPGERQKAA